MKVSTLWVKDLKDAEKEIFKKNLLDSEKVLDKLEKIVYNMIRDAETVSFKDYETPSWSHKQAHTNGYNEALRNILNLINLKDANTNG